MATLYAESERHSDYSRLPTDPGGQNHMATLTRTWPCSTITTCSLAYRITQPWEEDQVTWNTFTLGDRTARGSFSAQGQGWKTMEIAALVQEWVGGLANYGLVLHDEAANAYEHEVYYSSEYGEQVLRPKLYICWH